jgi:hypothetical protein
MGDVIQTGNVADIVAGRDVNLGTLKTPITRFLAAFRREVATGASCNTIIPDLQGFLESASSDELIGLTEKLEKGNRGSFLEQAKATKEAIAKKIDSHLFSISAQHIYTHLLDMAKNKFNARVSPLLIDGVRDSEVGKVLMEITDSIFSFLDDNDLELKHSDVLGLVFYLTGKCHLKWA